MLFRTGLMLAGAMALAAVVFTGGAGAQEPPSGDELMRMRCQGCHDLRPIQTSAMSAEEWTENIRVMVEENGAEVPAAEVPILARYLGIYYGPLPDGPGKEILLNICTQCHDLQRIKLGRRSAEEWEETLIAMLNEGAPLSEPQFVTIHGYLSRYFGVR